MQKKYWFFIIMVWAGLITSILADSADIFATIYGLETNFALGNILFHTLQIVALYLIVKKRALLYYLGLELFIFAFFVIGLPAVGLFVEEMGEKVVYGAYCIGALTIILSSWLSYKMLSLFYRLSEKKIFLYIIPFFIAGVCFSFGGTTISMVNIFNGEEGNEQYWLITSLLLDLIVAILSSIAFLKTKLETLIKNS